MKKLTLEFTKEGNKWLGYCKELTTSTFGNSLKEAIERLNEAVLLHIEALKSIGEWERFCKEHNI